MRNGRSRRRIVWGIMLATLLVTGHVSAEDEVSFIAGRVILAGGNPVSLAGGDFTGDRLPDLVIATLSTSGPSPVGDVAIWRGRGDATFERLPPAVAGISPRAVAVGDVNADGQLDVAVATASPNGLIMLLGRGDGTFQALPSAALGGLPAVLALGDVNGDGRPDVVVATSSPNALIIGLSRSDGTFQGLPPTVLPGLPTALALADFNGDGKLDLFVTTSSPNTMVILLGQGDGTLAVKASVVVSITPRAVAVGDFNGDGRADVAITSVSGSGSTGTGSVTMLLGQGDGMFQTAATVAVGNDVGAVVAADLNGDRRADLAVLSVNLSGPTTRGITVLLGQGDGSFAPLPAVPVGPSLSSTSSAGSLLVGDANGDGITDLAVANSTGSGGAPSGSVTILLGQGDGTFPRAPTFVVGSNPVALAVDDFDGDGRLEVATANQGSFDVSILSARDDGTVDGDNVLVGGSPAGLAVGDFNGDGVKDLAVALSDGVGPPAIGSIAILLGQGDGAFAVASSLAVGSGPAAVAVGDFNHDGFQDLAVVNQNSNTVAILLGQGNGAFELTHNFLVGVNPRAVVVADFNADGQLDLAVANSASNTVSIWLGRGDGSFQATPPIPVSGSPAALAVGDFNGDGRPDVAVARQSANAVTILLGWGDGSFQALPPAVVGGGQSAIAVGDFDGDGLQDVAVTMTIPGLPPVAGILAILPGQGDGTFDHAQVFHAGSGSGVSTLAAVAVGDFNGDGWPDLAVASASSDMVTILLNNTLGSAVATAHLR
jgi:hypothetical protein